ncbi:hypothetical protein PENSPDRAFT_752244 [Peniophora sp. CONT]|nr:hypothetical protein PENSPDRAFT_752244 [Peniophora sp. CONT]
MSTKRSASPSSPLSPSHKSQRIASSDARELVCSLPPTCSRNGGTRLQGTRELEAHYAKFHAHVCSAPGCECIFPEARLLELHLTECHDPLADVRKERGEKIFACHLATCPKHFRTPKNRRNHLISAHGYPRQYFFAITNYGMGEMLRRWGEGASMVRGDWRPREPAEENDSSDDEDAMEEDDSDSGAAKVNQKGRNNNNGRQVPPHMPAASTSASRPLPTPQPPKPRSASVVPTTSSRLSEPVAQSDKAGPSTTTGTTALDALADTMSSLSLVPSSIRFGRGAKSSGHTGRHSHSVSFASPVAQTNPLPPPSHSSFAPTSAAAKEQVPAKEAPALGSGLASLKLSPVLAQNGVRSQNGKGKAPTASNGGPTTDQSAMAVDTVSPTSPTSPASPNTHTVEGARWLWTAGKRVRTAGKRKGAEGWKGTWRMKAPVALDTT